MRLVIEFEGGEKSLWDKNSKINAQVYLKETINLNQIPTTKSIRSSPIFPVLDKNHTTSLAEIKFIHFLMFKNSFHILSYLKSSGNLDLLRRVFFSNGHCSIIILSVEKQELNKLLLNFPEEPLGQETWKIDNSEFLDFEFITKPKNQVKTDQIKFIDYKELDPISFSIIEELHIGLQLLSNKVVNNFSWEPFDLKTVIKEVNNIIHDLVLFEKGKDSPNATSFSKKNQSIDRLISLSSIISYVSTQYFSGAVPLFERRSLIRRHGLLGVGNSIRALNRITSFIETSFNSFNIQQVITEKFSLHAKLEGIQDVFNYDSSTWSTQNLDKYIDHREVNNGSFKLPFYSARLGFRETEYGISAAIQSISFGGNPLWSILTITHELMHSQVRVILNSIIFGSLKEESQSDHIDIYQKFMDMILNRTSTIHLIDSIRYIIFSHACLSQELGSISQTKTFVNSSDKKKFLPKPKDFKQLIEWVKHENSNISEIFVHVFDLHYIFRGQKENYFKLIWSSWSSLPHLVGDIRQYVLRSIIVLGIDVNSGIKNRYESARIDLIDILEELEGISDPLHAQILNYLKDEAVMYSECFGAFVSSIRIADLAYNIFFSEKVSATLYDDDLVRPINNVDDDLSFSYDLPDFFQDTTIKSPVAYLVDKMTNEIDFLNEMNEVESKTCLMMMAINCYNNNSYD